MKYKVGDKVKSLIENDGITKGKLYEITSIYPSIIGDGECIEFIDDLGELRGFYPGDYEPYEKSLDNLEVGDVIYDSVGDPRTVLAVCGKLIAISSTGNPEKMAWWDTVEYLKQCGYHLKEEPKEVELTMDEIADKFNVDVKKLKIKKEK